MTKEPKRELDAHDTHCCDTHGCKYGDPNCAVAGGDRPKRYCEECNLEEEGYYDGRIAGHGISIRNFLSENAARGYNRNCDAFTSEPVQSPVRGKVTMLKTNTADHGESVLAHGANYLIGHITSGDHPIQWEVYKYEYGSFYDVSKRRILLDYDEINLDTDIVIQLPRTYYEAENMA